MRTRRLLTLISIVLFCQGAALASQGPAIQPTVALVPFDIVNVEGGTRQVAEGLAKLVRAELTRQRKLRPVLVTVPADAELPLAPERAAELAKSSEAAVIVVGTVLEASTSRSSRRASTGGLGGISVGGSVSRTTATVSIQVDLVHPVSAEVIDTFEVEGKEADTGLGADLSTTVGSFDSGDASWDDSPMGKALREAAGKIAAELAKRAPKFGQR